MPKTNIETPDWLREMETILEELNEGVVVVDGQLRVIFANEALTRMGHFGRNQIQGCTPDAIFPSEDLPYIKRQHESGHQQSGGHPVTQDALIRSNSTGDRYPSDD